MQRLSHRERLIRLMPAYQDEIARIERDAKIVELHQVGMVASEIASQLSISRTTVQRVVCREGVTYSRSQSLHLQFAVIRAYLGGVRRSALPTAFDRTEAAIDTILAHIGPRAAALSGRHAERAVELHDAGVAIGEIAARLGIKPRGVEFYLKECIDECKNES